MSSVPYRSKLLSSTLSLGSVATVLAFLGYSLALFFLAVICAGAGDGTYVPFRVFSSPLALVSFKASLFGCLLLWVGVGLLIIRVPNRTATISFLALMVVHYTGIVVIAVRTTPSEWSRFYEAASNSGPGMFVLTGFLLYAIGQVLIWRAYNKRTHRVRERVDQPSD